MKQHKISLLPKMIVALSLLTSAIAFADNGKSGGATTVVEAAVQPNQMVTLASSETTLCALPSNMWPSGGQGYVIDQKINPDLSRSPFVIARGYAFVITNTDDSYLVFENGNKSELMYTDSSLPIEDLVAYSGTVLCTPYANNGNSRLRGHLVKAN